MSNFIPTQNPGYKLCDYCGKNAARFKVFNLNWTGFWICPDCKDQREKAEAK